MHELLEVYRPGLGQWLLRSIIQCVTLFALEEEGTQEFIIGELLERSRSSYEDRFVLENYLSLLREKSYAPVCRCDVQYKWLAGEA
jgi:hypothetical protein